MARRYADSFEEQTKRGQEFDLFRQARGLARNHALTAAILQAIMPSTLNGFCHLHVPDDTSECRPHGAVILSKIETKSCRCWVMCRYWCWMKVGMPVRWMAEQTILFDILDRHTVTIQQPSSLTNQDVKGLQNYIEGARFDRLREVSGW